MLVATVNNGPSISPTLVALTRPLEGDEEAQTLAKIPQTDGGKRKRRRRKSVTRRYTSPAIYRIYKYFDSYI